MTQPLGIHRDYGRFYFETEFVQKDKTLFSKTADIADIKKA